MYVLQPRSVWEFIDDPSIGLPRFQRKPSWSSKDNFELCLSVFRGYPLGVTVVKLEDHDGRRIRTLLDGRQRRLAFEGMRDPQQVYKWARSSLRLRVRDTELQVSRKFWRFVENYYGVELSGAEEALESETSATEEMVDDQGGESEADSTSEESAEPEGSHSLSGSAYADYSGLSQLLALILAVHPIQRRRGVEVSEFSEPFDFSDQTEDLDFVGTDTETGGRMINTEKLVRWIYYRRAGSENVVPTPEEFLDWIRAGGKITVGEDQVKRKIEGDWRFISRGIAAVNTLRSKLLDAVIGVIEVSRSTPSDDKKIFTLINSSGTQLTAEEILSAKPAWNMVVDSPHVRLVEDATSLYRGLGLPVPDTLVRWDVAATLLDRLEVPFILGD